LDDTYCSTSSIMPQKKNPDTAEIMRAKTGSVFGAFAGAFTIIKGLPMSYNRDLQELTPNLWRGVHSAGISTWVLLGMLETAKFDVKRMREEAGKGFSTATELADTLVRSYDLPFRTAHSIVGRAVQKGSLTLATLDKAAAEVAPGTSLKKMGLTQKEIDEALDSGYSIAIRDVTGGPAPKATKKAIAARRKQAAADSELIRERFTNLKKTTTKLTETARRLVA